MPAIGNITINDGKTTPLAHLFEPVRTNGQLSKHANNTASILAGRETLQVEVTEPATPTAAHRIKIKLTLPTIAVVNTVDTIVRTSSAEIVVNMSQLSTLADRKDMRALLANAILNASMTDVFEKFQPIY